MFAALARKVFGTANDRSVRSLQRRVGAINALETDVAALSDDALRARTQWLRDRLADGETLDDLLTDAFATVREAARRVLGQRHFDVQLMGGMALHEGRIAEMRTGEGKTLVATLAVYLNALPGEGVHVVTVNDYLARRDSAIMGRVYGFLGLTTGCIVPGLDDGQRRAAYASDITYATNNELGFDYLRDNMKFRPEEMVQRPFAYAIVDEVDSILIDEARTPLIISGPTDDGSAMYAALDRIMEHLTPADWEKDEKGRSVTMTEAGAERAEAWLRQAGLLTQGAMYDLHNIGLVHHVTQALRAHTLFQRDKDYIVKDGKVIIIDEFSGRMMDGRRYSEGLHQALEAKEGVAIQEENQTLASITFQNYFRMYPKLAGMTGTAMTEAAELGEIYKLDVVDIPTNTAVRRVDHDDEVYRTLREKDAAIVALVQECHARRQPMLIGTASIERSESISKLLAEHAIAHEVLNARHHEREAHIIAQAGRPGAVTVATNMAGRGTDIQLGGNVEMRIADETAGLDDAARAAAAERIRSEVAAAREEVRAAGGLYVVGTERNESRRIDNQLRGRSGRQGDPGASKFFLSLEDDLMRIFGSERMGTILEKLGVREGEAIVHPWINKALEKAQTKVEAHNFEIRKNLLKYDDVMNEQRRAVYQQRLDVMTADDPDETVDAMRREAIAGLVRAAIPEHAYPEQWNLAALHEECLRVLALDLPLSDWAEEEGIAETEIEARIVAASDALIAAKRQHYGDELLREARRMVLLQMLDTAWKDHLLQLDHLRQGINLRAYAQKDPLLEYKREAYNMFEAMLDGLRSSVTSVLSHLEIANAPGAGPAPDAATNPTVPIDGSVPRNAPCPCGSGLRYKHCHGSL